MSKTNKESNSKTQVESIEIPTTVKTVVLDGAGVSQIETPIEKEVRDRAAAGFNINQIAAQLAIPSQVVKEILK